jgi:NADPH:quinone reductase-like Zn-dependent oxidoreductase
VLRVEELEPSMPDALQVLVGVKAASVNPVDIKICDGQYPAVKEDRLPYMLGRDVSGIVETCGAQATQYEIGDEVLGMVIIWGGGYAEKVVLDQNALALKPRSIDHLQAAAIPLAGLTAWQGLFRRGQLKKGQTALIHGGSGGVGHFAIQFAKATGAHVLATVSTENVDFARRLGPDVVIDYKTQRFEEQAENIDMVFDLIDGETRERSWDLLKCGGVLVSTLTEPSQEKAEEYRVRALRYTVEPDAINLAGIVKLVAAGKVRPHVQEAFRLEDAAEAMGIVEHGGPAGKIVLSI